MFTKKYRFAGGSGCVLEIGSEFEFPGSGYTDIFALPDGAPDAPTYTVHADFADDLPVPPAAAVETDRRTAWRDGAHDRCIRYYCKNRECRRFPYVFADRCGLHIELVFLRGTGVTVTARTMLEAAGLAALLLDAGSIVLHSSFVISGGAALIFSGASGAGKSTQAELWRSTVGASIVNGDRTLITPTDAGADAAGIIWCGTSGICRDLTAPIRAIALISHGNENSARPATPIEAFSAILGQTTYDINDPCAVSAATDICARVISRVPVIRLSCLPDASAVHFYGKYLDEVAQKWKTT